MNNHDKTIINLKVSKSLKQEAQELAEEIGVPLSTVIIANLRDFVRSRTLTVSALPRLKPTVEKEIGQALNDYNQNKNVSPELNTPQEVAAYLQSL